jgi:hypothetical protein
MKAYLPSYCQIKKKTCKFMATLLKVTGVLRKQNVSCGLTIKELFSGLTIAGLFQIGF